MDTIYLTAVVCFYFVTLASLCFGKVQPQPLFCYYTRLVYNACQRLHHSAVLVQYTPCVTALDKHLQYAHFRTNLVLANYSYVHMYAGSII